MNGAARMPKFHSTEFADAPSVSINISKVPWCKHTHSAPRSSPPRLLLVVLLLGQLIILAIVRLCPGAGSVWSLNSINGLHSSSSSSSPSMHMDRPLSFLPQKDKESLVSQGSEEASVLSRSSIASSSKSTHGDADEKIKVTFTEESSSHTDSISHSPSTKGNAEIDARTSGATIENDRSSDRETDTAGSTLNGVAVVTYSDEAKNEQALIAENASKKHSNGKAEKSMEAQHDASHDFAMGNEHTTSEAKANNLMDKEEHGFLAMKENGELASTASYEDAQNVYAQGVNEVVGSSSECGYGYVYVYDLPPMFNAGIVANCTALNVFRNVCDILSNGGLGPLLGDASPLGQLGSWFRSDQFTAEMVFHNRILQHPCLTDKPEKASSFYVPYYAGLDVGRFLWREFSAERRDRVGTRLLEWLAKQPAWQRNDGWGHFLMVGRISWDFRRSKDEDWGSGLFHHPLMQNMTRLLIEKNPWDYMEMAVPYLTNFHPKSDTHLAAWQNHIRGLKRSHLFSFAGAPRSTFPNDFRGILLNQCQQSQSCQSLDCSKRRCENNQRTLELFMDSNFCLQPRGDSFTRRSTFDCLLAGSIPVFFWHRSAYMQYKWHLPVDVGSYSVFISKDAMKNGTWIEDVLGAISLEKVQSMREVVIEMVPRITYALSGSALKGHNDAFDVAIEGVMKRFKELNLSPQR